MLPLLVMKWLTFISLTLLVIFGSAGNYLRLSNDKEYKVGLNSQINFLNNENTKLVEENKKLQEQIKNSTSNNESNLQGRIISVDCPRFATTSRLSGDKSALPCWFNVVSGIESEKTEGLGIATLSGEYVTYLKTDPYWSERPNIREDKLIECEAIKVSGGTKTFVDSIRESTMGGNTVNHITPAGDLLINIPVSELDNRTVEQIRASTGTIHIAGLVDVSLPQGASPCHSSLDKIIGVEIK